MAVISIVIPAYNVEKTVLETISSIQKQTFQDWETIVIDDGSTDGTFLLLKTLKDQRIKVLSHPNQGVSVTRNVGISQAQGEFIALLDADDLWTPDKLEAQLTALRQHPDAALAYSWTDYIDEQGKILWQGQPLWFEDNVYSQLLIENFLASGSNPLIRKTAIKSIGGFDPMLKIGEDWEFYVRLAAKYPFVVVPKKQILYRQWRNSATSNIERIEEQLLVTINKIFVNVPSQLQYLKKQSVANVHIYLVQKYLENRSHEQAIVKFKKALCLYPPIFWGQYAQGLLRRLIKSKILTLMSLS